MPIKPCILIADDESLNYLFYREIINSEKYDIIYVDNGNDVVKTIREKGNEISLILMDMKMPGMDGFTATAEIRKFNKDIPIIAQTAYAYKDDFDKALQAGCNDYLSKPIHEEVLISKIESFLV
jgi:CheY-like chemotaxis protein